MDSAVASSIASPPPALNDASDCGSSSGVGGMKDASPPGSDAASSSSEVTPAVANADIPSDPNTPHCFEKRPSLPHSRYSMPPPPPLFGPMIGVGPTPLHGPINNDLFVHISPGEQLSIIVHGEIQTIAGPATVRMVGEAGAQALTCPLPLHVPKGHMVHQICDDQGFLRHIILSPETRENATPSANVSPGAIPSTSTAPPSVLRPSPSTMPPPSYHQQSNHHSSFYTVNRQYPRGMAASTARRAEPLLATPTPLLAAEPLDTDQEEVARIQTMLNRIMPPTVQKLQPDEAEIGFQEMDTSEANSGHPFPQIDASEFSYQLSVQEAGRNANRAKDIILKIRPSGTAGGTRVPIKALIPNREYNVRVQARLEERCLTGEWSSPHWFKTPPTRPDPPTGLKVEAILMDSCVLRWNQPAEFYQHVTHYSLYRLSMADGIEHVELFLETRETAVTIDNLKPAASYKFKVTAHSKFGESLPSNHASFVTRGELTFSPIIVACGTHSAKISWTGFEGWTYTVEQMNALGATLILKNRGTGCFQYANDLTIYGDYTFRVIAHSPDNGFIPSEVLTYRHFPPKNGNRDGVPAVPSFMPTPARPYIVNANKPDPRKPLEIGWRQVRDVFYVLEGSHAAAASGKYEWRQVYRGFSTSMALTDEHAGMIFFRLQHQAKKHSSITSEWSEVLRIPGGPVKPAVYRIPPLHAPVFSEVGKHSMRISWHPSEFSPAVAGTTVLYELRRLDGVSQLLYSGPEPTFLMESLRPKQYVTVQARIVAIDGTGKRTEGDWSPTGMQVTLRDAPHPPHSLALSQDRRELHWAVSEDLLGDVSFTVTRTTVGDEAAGSEVSFTTAALRMCLTDLAPGVTYAFQVVARCPWGDSAPSETFRMSTAAEVPCAPEAVAVEADAQRELTVRWTPPDARGSALRSYHVRVERDRQVVRESMLAAASSSTDEVEFRVEDLEPDTVYSVFVAASNDVGTGPSSKADGRTRRQPPPPPALDAEVEPNQIKLKWKAPIGAAPGSTLGYRIARLAEGTNAHMPCYEGDLCSTKIKGLAENSTYRFQIRSFDRDTGSGPWSDVFTFRTPLAPPPWVRVVPTATSNGNGSHTLDWVHVFGKDRANPRGLFYRVQTHSAGDKKDQWTTVYEGGANSCILRLPAESSLLARVFVVRPDGGTGIVSQPSPPLHVSSIGETKQEEEIAPVDAPASLFQSIYARVNANRFSFSILALFIVALAYIGFVWKYDVFAPAPPGAKPAAPAAAAAAAAAKPAP